MNALEQLFIDAMVKGQGNFFAEVFHNGGTHLAVHDLACQEPAISWDMLTPDDTLGTEKRSAGMLGSWIRERPQGPLMAVQVCLLHFNQYSVNNILNVYPD